MSTGRWAKFAKDVYRDDVSGEPVGGEGMKKIFMVTLLLMVAVGFISTKAAIREMVLPGLMAVSVPVIVGFFDPKMLSF